VRRVIQILSAARRALPAAAASACAALAALHARAAAAGAEDAAQSAAASSSSAAAQPAASSAEAAPSAPALAPPEWAHPSPYDADAAAATTSSSAAGGGRFASSAHLRTLRAHWDLPKLVAQWQASDDEETWPWVWCQHNPTGPHHVFVGLGAGTLERIRGVSAADASNNITVVIRDDGELARRGLSEAQLHALRCAVVRERVAQVDAESKLLMLRDERVIAYDAA
jgi:hypothetical protein